MILLLVDNFEGFEGVINEGVICMPVPCKYKSNNAYFVPYGWQQDLELKSISYQEVEENEITTQEFKF